MSLIQTSRSNNLSKRNFLKENIESLKLKSKAVHNHKILKSQNSKLGPSSSSLLSTINAFDRLAAGGTRGNYNKVEKLTKVLSNIELACENLEVVRKITTSTQTSDILGEEFMEGEKLLEASVEVLKEIRDARAKKLEKSLKEKLKEKRIFDKGSEKLEAHLSDLKEFLDTGSISKRKTVTEHVEKNVFNESFLQILESPVSIPPYDFFDDGSEENKKESIGDSLSQSENIVCKVLYKRM